MSAPSTLYPKKVELNNCDKEPIHLIGHIQDFGCLIAVDKNTLKLTYFSENSISVLNISSDEIQNFLLSDIISSKKIKNIKKSIKESKPVSITERIRDKDFTVVIHLSQNNWVLEFEKETKTINPLKYQEDLSKAMTELNSVQTEQAMCDKASELIREFYGYDRVMIYKFDADWNGKIVSEIKNKDLESWLGLNYPASDIPQQARKLFLRQGVRIIENVESSPVPVHAVNSQEQTLDLSRSELRSVSPIHIEYLNNMKVGATLTAAIIFQGELWGLVACHHYSPKYISYFQRLSCKFLTQVFSSQLGLRTANTLLKKVSLSNSIRSTLIEQMSQNWDIHEGLSRGKHTILNITEAQGAAICVNNKITLVGETPSEKDIKKIIDILIKNNSHLYISNHFSGEFSQFEKIKEKASGVLAIFISKNRKDVLLWFKPEVLQSVDWAGNPNKTLIDEETSRLSPRKSFDKWSEEQTGHSKPWLDYEISAIKALKENISEIIIQKYDEITALNEKLKKAYNDLESFSYSVSHDLRSPLRGIDGYAQIIKEDYYESLDEFGKQAIQTIIKSTNRMNLLIDDILTFSGLGKKNKVVQNFSMNQLVNDVVEYLQLKNKSKKYEIIINNLPNITADRSMVFQLVLNLIGNAAKYSSQEHLPKIEVGYIDDTYFVKDNGIGFDLKHKSKIFGVFNRLVNDEYEGSGIGLAVSKRVIERHNGKIWAESEPGKGATFYFNLN